jgi:hypothetical protein
MCSCGDMLTGNEGAGIYWERADGKTFTERNDRWVSVATWDNWIAMNGPGREGTGAGAKKLKIVVTGGHPDDPESGCGGTIALYTSLGHEVTILYLTRGEAGIAGMSLQEAATIRSAECEKACEILKARSVFAGRLTETRK